MSQVLTKSCSYLMTCQREISGEASSVGLPVCDLDDNRQVAWQVTRHLEMDKLAPMI